MPENIEHDIEHFESRRAEGTCTGILQKEPVKAWLEGNQAKVLWIFGRPARGKSVIASYLSRYLQSEGILTQFFFFRAGDDSKRTISSFLSSMAFQTCLNIPQFRKATSETVKSGWKVRETEWRTLWKRIFENMLLEFNITRPIYWVIDGIDECSSSLPLLELISAINQSKLPIYIALISRWGEDISSALERAKTKASYLSLCIDKDDEDIRLFIDDELKYTNWGDEVRASVKDEILKNANDNFLWVSLVLEEMKDCHTEDDIKERLVELPHGMSSLYQRMEKAILALKRPSDKSLSQRLLSWVVQARKALTTAELVDILEPDFGRILDLSHTLGRLCGQFITVEGDKSVSLVHHTAREYLTHESSLASTLNNAQTHADLFKQSLSAFSQRNISTKLASSSPSVFKYRAMAWPYHLSASKRSGRIDEQLNLLCTFFSKQSVLTWINIVASLKHLRALVDASQSIDAFVKAKRKADAAKDPTSRRYDDLEKLEGWSKDLLKVMGKFGSNLLQDPETVYHCLAPFCPTSSQIFKSFGVQNSTGIQVSGQTNEWDDCLARVSLGSGSVGTLIACSDAHIAIVDSSGRITIWDATAFELVAVLSHGEMISAVCFNGKGDSLATYGGKTTKIWNTRLGSLEVTFPNLDGTCAICMHFTDNDHVLMIVSNQQYVCRAAIFTHPIGWNGESVGDVRDGEEFDGAFETAPTTLTISPDGQKVASTFRAYPVTISSTTSFRTLQRVTRTSRLVSGLKAAPFASDVAWHPDSEQLLGVFKDGFSFRLNIIDGAYQEFPPTLNQHPIGIHCSPDGAAYAILNGNGSVEAYDYRSSTMIYQLSSPGRISAFSFSCDGRRFYDVRRSHCTIWEPNALVRLSTSEDEPAHSLSFDDSAPKSSVASEGQDDLSAPAILISYQNRRSLIALADADGSVDIIDTKTLQKRNVANISSRARAGHLAWNHNGTSLCYSELRRQISVFDVYEDKAQLTERILTKKVAKGMTQVAFLGDSNMLLIASESGAFMFSRQPATLKASFLVDPGSPQRHWLTHPSLKQFIIAVGVDGMTVHSSEDLQQIAQCQWKQHAPGTVDKANRDSISPVSEEVSDVRATFYLSYIIVKISRKTPLQDLKPRFTIFDVAGVDARGGTAEMITIPETVFSAIELPLNILANGNFVFLDSFFWVCSWNVKGGGVTRHFFIPRDWLPVQSLDLIHLTESGAILCPRKGGVSTVRGYVRTSW
ncbi:WD40 repeat-like-containing domain protein [Akanthomyces lecanii RCEF 1005]|uniref:WD40 repeat-like-containing domain protein n=1 Tax=Akanthomyces lecanii RCEF 1005 TaxID=1081108 RepID=A0A162L034_CORDF|nr:WD40 repeat-like-containing domain protein [Akanthomyces lecanii RCEF 1005]